MISSHPLIEAMKIIPTLTTCPNWLLYSLQEQILSYIPEDQHTVWNWVLSPFNKHAVNEADLNPLIQDKLIELSCDKTLQLSFINQDVDKFWLQRRAEEV
uniref:Uncharacterized protein n=1 Tax=Graphocephala atropunctata TaxID=36148 RepID=A0A1B6LDR0_9HEMI